MTVKDDAWFAPKRFGYGAGLPIKRAGWVSLGLYLIVFIGAARWLMPLHPTPFIILALVATAIFVGVAARHTRGGWAWRWGDE